MRWFASRQSALIAVSVLLAAGGVTAAATRGGPAPAEFSGTVYLPNGQPAKNATLLGSVTTYSYAEPLSKRGVPLGGGGLTGSGTRGDYRLVTDARGRYRLRVSDEPAEEGRARERVRRTYQLLLCSPTGLGYAQVGQVYQGVTPGARLDIRLREGDRVAGRVVGYPGGKPLAGVQVEAAVGIPGSRGHGWQMAGKATTDKEGRFRLSTSLPPNGYRLEAKPAGWAMMETQIEPPPSKEPAARTAELRLARAYAIRGHAYGPDGQPLRKTHLEFKAEGFAPSKPGLLSTGFGGSAEATTDEAGAFAMPEEGGYLPYGEGPYLHHYLALTPKPQGGMVARPALVDATDPATQSFDLQFVAPATVAGRQVEAASGRPAAGARARLVPVQPNLPPAEWSKLSEGILDEAHSVIKDDQTGKFVLRGVPPGEYRLQLEGWTIRGRTAADRSAVAVTVKPGETVDVGTVQVVSVPHLRGQFTGLPWTPDPADEDTFHGVLRPSGSTGPGQEGYADLWAGGGKYTLWATGRPAGTYDAVLIAWRGGTRYVTQVQHGLELQEETPLEGIDLRFTQGASLRGKVVQANGRPLPKTTVTVRGVGGDAVMFSARDIYNIGPQMYVQLETNSKGEFATQGLLPGEYEVTALPEPVFLGPPPKARVRVGAAEQKRGVVLRAKRNG